MILNKKYLTIYFSFFFLGYSFSQELVVKTSDSTKTEHLGEVIVSATRTARQLSSLPLPAQVISKRDIRSSNSVRLSDILNEQTGLITVPDFGGGQGIQLQGLDSQYTLILIDGVPLVGRSAGTLDLSRVTVGNIKQIEVVKGASSALYGNEALGGVVNIITETPKLGFNGNQNYRGGTLNAHDLSTNISYKKNKLGVTTFLNRYSSYGYDLVEDNETNTVEPFVNYTFNTSIFYRFSDATKITVSGRYYQQEQDNIASNELSGESKIDEWNATVVLNHKFNEKWDSYIEFYTTQYKTEEYLNDADGNLFDQSNFNQRFIRPELRTTFSPVEEHTFITGFGLTNERLDRTLFSTTPEFNSPYIYVQYDGTLTDALNLILGARFDSHSEYESQFSPKAAIRYKLNDKIAVKGSVGYGFKAPDFRQLYLDFTNSTVGYTVLGYNEVPKRLQELFEQEQLNLDNLSEVDQQVLINTTLATFDNPLKAESSISYNFGLDYAPITNLSLNINIFRNDIENLIDTRVLFQKQNGQNVFSYYNVNKVYTQGIEFNTVWKPTTHLKIAGGYQLLYAKDKEAEKAFKEDGVFARESAGTAAFRLEASDYFGLFNRSRHMANLKLFYTIPKWDVDTNLRTTYRSKYGLFDSNDNNYLDAYDDFVDGYTIIDLAVNKSFFENYQVGFGVDNLFDFTDPQNISNIPGRLIYGKLNIQF
ncbi:TonB-dependent receptor [Flavobacteriaceae bacterium MHTCC 0001]